MTRYGLFQAGFTLTELVVVLTILGILSSVGISKFASTSSFKEKGFTDETLASLRYGHRLATSSGCHVRITLDNNELNIARWAACKPADHTTATTLLRSPDNRGNFSNTVPSGISVSNLDVYFDGTGKPFLTSSQTALNNVTDITIGSNTIKLEPETGFTHL